MRRVPFADVLVVLIGAALAVAALCAFAMDANAQQLDTTGIGQLAITMQAQQTQAPTRDQVEKRLADEFHGKIHAFIDACNRMTGRYDESHRLVWPAPLARECQKAFDRMAADPAFRTR